MKKILIRGLSFVVLICSVVSTEGMKDTNNIGTNVGINLSQNDDNLLMNNVDIREQQIQNDLREFRECSQNDDNLFSFLSDGCAYSDDFCGTFISALVDEASKIVASEETLDRAIGLLKSRIGKDERWITCMVDLLKLRKLYKKNEVSITTFFKFLSDAYDGCHVEYCTPEIIEQLKSIGEQDNFHVKRAIVLKDLYEYVFRSNFSNNLSAEAKDNLYMYLKEIYLKEYHPEYFLLPRSYLGAPEFCIPSELAIDWIQKNVENSAKEEIIDLLKLRIAAGSDNDLFSLLLDLYRYSISDYNKEWILDCPQGGIITNLENGLKIIKDKSYDSNERVFVCIDKMKRLLKLIKDFNGETGELFPLLFISDKWAHKRQRQLEAELVRKISDLEIEGKK